MNLKDATTLDLLAEIERRIEKTESYSDKEEVIEDIFTCTTYDEVLKRLEKLNMLGGGLPTNHSSDKRIDAFIKIKNIEKYFNQGWKPDWRNVSEYKWYPVFEYDLLSDKPVCFDVETRDSFGQIAFYKTISISSHVGKYFSEIYSDLL